MEKEEMGGMRYKSKYETIPDKDKTEPDYML